MFNAWTIWWNADRLGNSFENYWDAPIFAPSNGAFALSEPQPATLLVWPATVATTLAAAFNLYLVITFVLNGLCSYRLLTVFGCQPFFAFSGAIAICLHPLAISNLEAVQLLPMWNILWVLEQSYKLALNGRFKDAVLLALAIALTPLTSLHHALFLGLLLPPTFVFVICWQSGFSRVTACKLVLFAGASSLAIAITFAWISPMLELHRNLDLSRSKETVRILSANWADWLSVPKHSFWRFANAADRLPLSPGWFRIGIVFLGISFFRFSRLQSSAILLLTALLTLSIVLSFGGRLEFLQWNAWFEIGSWFSPLSRIRSPYRFAYFSQLAVLLLAALCCNRIFLLGWAENVSNRTRGFWKFASILMVILIAFEIPPPRSFICRLPAQHQIPEWVDMAREGRGPLLCLPVSPSISEVDSEVAARWMIYATQHRRAILNGYSGFVPEPWNSLRPRLQAEIWDESLWKQLRELGVEQIVVRTKDMKYSLDSESGNLHRVHTEPGFELWELRQEPASRRP